MKEWMDLFAKERIMFRKLFRITFHFLIGFRDLNYVRSQALQLPPRSQTGSAHCEVMGLFTVSESHSEELSVHKSSESGFLVRSRSKTPSFLCVCFKLLIWKSFAFTKGKIRLLNQERVRITISNMAFAMWNLRSSSEQGGKIKHFVSVFHWQDSSSQLIRCKEFSIIRMCHLNGHCKTLDEIPSGPI